MTRKLGDLDNCHDCGRIGIVGGPDGPEDKLEDGEDWLYWASGDGLFCTDCYAKIFDGLLDAAAVKHRGLDPDEL